MQITKPSTPPGRYALRVLRILAERQNPITAKELGIALYGVAFNARTRSSSASQLAWELIRRGLAERTLKRRELYVYEITDAGRAFLAEAASDARPQPQRRPDAGRLARGRLMFACDPFTLALALIGWAACWGFIGRGVARWMGA